MIKQREPINAYTPETVAWRYDGATNDGDWHTGYSEYEQFPSETVRDITPLVEARTSSALCTALNRALDFIESLTADPLLMGVDDIEMTLEDVQAHARIELDSIRSALAMEGAARTPPQTTNLTPEQHRHAQFMGGIGDEVWD